MDGKSISDATRTVSLWGPEAELGSQQRSLLHVVHPPELATVVELSTDRTVLGRKPTAEGPTVEIGHSTVSRAHVAVEWSAADDVHVVWDLGSHNGSWLDGQRIAADALRLDHGAVLRIGDVLAVYERASVAPAELAEGVSHDAIPGDAAATFALRSQVALAGFDPSPALLLGETGTGKEWIATELHRFSARSGPFCAVNCAALAATLVESQLFGHVKGAFTGATGAQKGLFREADGGSLFLDEIGELPIELQAKLLRTLQEREVMPLGSSRAYSVDARVIAATNADLNAQIPTGEFRRDLFARLAMWEIAVPPLRERRPDILAWTQRLFGRWSEERGRTTVPPVKWTTRAAQQLLLAPWDENIRGIDRLIHAVAARIVQGQVIDEPHLPKWVGEADVSVAVQEVEKSAAPAKAKPPVPSGDEFREFMASNDNSVHAAARHYQRDRRQIYRWIKRFGVER